MPRNPRQPKLIPARKLRAAMALMAPSRMAEPQRAQPAECRLAYGLESQFGRVCSRLGGDAVCGACISDLDAPMLGFRRDGTKEAAGSPLSLIDDDFGWDGQKTASPHSSVTGEDF